MSTPALNPLVEKIRAKYPGSYDDMDDAALTKAILARYPQYSDLAAPAMAKPTVNMQPVPETFMEQRRAQFMEGMNDTAEFAKAPISKVANEVYDVSAPNIATQVYRQIMGKPNTLEKLPPKMVLAFLTAGGLPESEALAPVVKEAEAAAPVEAAAKAVPKATPEAATAEAVPPQPTPSGAGLPRTLAGESALRQVLTGQGNANLMKIAKSRGINVTQEIQLKPSIADKRLVDKIIDDFSQDELDGFRDTFIEQTRMARHKFGDIGAEANETLAMKTYFPDVKLTAASQARTAKAIQTAGETSLNGSLKEMLKRVQAGEKLKDLK